MDDQQYTPAQVAEKLDVGPTAVRKYSLLLEQHGHKIERNNKGYRVYSDYDVKLLRALLILNRDRSMTLEDASSKVTEAGFDFSKVPGFYDDTHSDAQSAVSTAIATQFPAVAGDVASYEAAVALIAQLQQQVELSNALHTKFMAAIDEKLQEQSEQIEKQTQVVISQAKTIELQTEAIVALSEELKKVQAEQKRSIWSRLFSRGDSDASKKG